MLKTILAVGLALQLGAAAAAQAQGRGRDFANPGPYIGMGATYAIQNIGNDFDDLGTTDLDPTNSWGLNAKAGYRWHRLVATEANFEWYQDFEFEGPQGSDLVRTDGWSLMGAAKLYPITGWIQPYLLGGAGVLQLDTEDTFAPLTPPANLADDTEFAVRGGAGFDLYPFRTGAWKGLVLDASLSYVYPTGDLQDFQFLSLQFGVQYRWALAPAPLPPAPPPAAKAAPAPPPTTARPLRTKKRIVLRGVNFDYDKAVIRPDARPVLDEAIATLREDPTIAVVAEGHTDSRGSDAYNQALALRRATAVRDYLVNGGIAASRVQVQGLGEAKPVATNDSDDGRAQNRRVELRVIAR